MSSDTRRGPLGGSPDERDIVIGKVVSVNVPRRELRIAPETSHPERFHALRHLRLKTREKQTVLLTVASVRVTRSAVIAKVEAEDDNQVASARGALVVVPLSERFPLPEHEYYVDDLVGLTVKDKEGSVVGRLCEIWETPANDIYRVLDDEGRETLLPAIEDIILRVDVESGEMIADISRLE